jgi:dTDP-4-amino-4,6-dideoxygalactose transaminase
VSDPVQEATAAAASAAPVPLLDLAREFDEVGPELLAAVEAVFRSQRFILGPEVAAFEQAAAAACGAPEAVGCGSGTDALWLALAGCGLLPGDRVLTTPFSFFATASAVLRAGATPVFADIDPRTANLSPAAAAEVLARHPGTRALLPVHLYGQCADCEALAALAGRHGCTLVEDAAQAFGARWQGRPAGSLGQAAAFSFYPTKNLSAAGEAGLVTTASPAIARRMRSLRTHGMERRYYHDEIGWNSRLDTLQAAVLLVKLRHLDRWTANRRALAARYDTLFNQTGLVEPGPYPEQGVVLPWTDPRAFHVFHQYVIRVPRRDALRARLAEAGIGSEIYYPVPLHLQKALSPLGLRAGDFPESERAAREVLALPIFPQLREQEQERVVAAVEAFFRG